MNRLIAAAFLAGTLMGAGLAHAMPLAPLTPAAGADVAGIGAVNTINAAIAAAHRFIISSVVGCGIVYYRDLRIHRRKTRSLLWKSSMLR